MQRSSATKRSAAVLSLGLAVTSATACGSRAEGGAAQIDDLDAIEVDSTTSPTSATTTPLLATPDDFVVPTAPSTTLDLEAIAEYVRIVESLEEQRAEAQPDNTAYETLTLSAAAAPQPTGGGSQAWGGQSVAPSGQNVPWTGELDEAGRPLAVYRGLVANYELHQQVVPAAVAPAPPVPSGVSPLSGLPTSWSRRSALIVKVDNSSAARPQAGLTSADIVVEERVEGGITRLAIVFQSRTAVVGPVRSVRSTDVGIIGSFNRPLFAWSGGNLVFRRLLAEQPVVDVGAGAASGYWRQNGRSAPYNLFVDTRSIAGTPGGGAPAAQFVFRASGGSLPSGAVPTARALLNNGASPSSFTWDGAGWLRDQRGRPHVDANSGAQVRPANVIIQETQQVPTGLTDSAGSIVPEDLNVGNGRAVVLTAGHRVNATWTKPTLASVTTYTDASGAHIEMTPGQTWIVYVAPGTYSFA